MNSKKRTIPIDGEMIPIVVVYSDLPSRDESYREVFLKDSSRGWIRGLFGCYPVGSFKATQSWKAPVEWEDGQWLYIPDLDEEHIDKAIKYLYEQDKIDATFEECDEPDETFPTITELPESMKDGIKSNTEMSIRQKIFGIMFQLKSIGAAKTKEELLAALQRYGKEVIESMHE